MNAWLKPGLIAIIGAVALVFLARAWRERSKARLWACVMVIDHGDDHDEYRLVTTGTEAECRAAMERAPTVIREGMSVSRASLTLIPLSEWNRDKPNLALKTK